MFAASLSLSVASPSDLLARFIAIVQKTPEFARICASDFYQDCLDVRRQLEKLQRTCQRYSTLNVTFCAAKGESQPTEGNLLTEALRLLELAEQVYQYSGVAPQLIFQSSRPHSRPAEVRSETTHELFKEIQPQPVILVCYLGEDESLSNLLLGLPALVSKSHYEIEIVGIVRATALQSDPSELNECQVCVSASSLLAPQSKVPIIHIKHPQPLSRIRSASLADIDGTHGASDHAFPPCHAVQEGIMLGVMCTNSPEIYDCIAWSIHQLVQHEAFTRSVLGPPIGNLRSPPSPVRGATSDHSLSLENIIRELDSHRWWWSALALSWIAFTECTFNTTELLSALVAEGAYRSSVESTAVFNMHLSTLHDTELKSLLYQALIISEAGEIMLSREEARATLMRLIADVGGLDDGAIHEMIAYTCLRCIECYQPTSVLRPWTIKESYADPQPSTSRLLLYATSFWHVHFRLAEDCSHRLSALLQRIIRSALTLDQENCQTDRIDAVQIINVGMWICAFYGFSLLARTYLEMGAEIDPFSWPHTNPLHVAASRSSLSVLEVVLASHPSLDTVNQEGMTPLHIAAFYGNVEAAKMLLDAGSDANAVCPKSRETALHIAVRSGHGTVVALLLDQGADIDAKNRAFETAMSIALQHKMHAIAQTLEQCGAARSNPLPMGTSAADVIYDLQALSLAELDTSSPQDASSYDLQQSAEVHINISYHQ